MAAAARIAAARIAFFIHRLVLRHGRENFLVHLDPGPLLVGREQPHYFPEAGHHILPDLRDETEARRGDLDFDFSAIVARMGPPYIAEFFQTVHKSGGGGGGMAHFRGDLRHGEVPLEGEVAEQEILGERDLSAGEFLGEIHQEAALEGRENIGKLLAIASDLAVTAGSWPWLVR